MKEADLKTQFQEIENRLNEAYERNDAEAISKLLSDDWMILEPTTGLLAKDKFLAAIKDGRLTHKKMKKEVLQVKWHNEIAIVIARGKNEGQYLDKVFDSEQWVTNIYRRKDGDWLCVMTQEAPVSC